MEINGEETNSMTFKNVLTLLGQIKTGNVVVLTLESHSPLSKLVIAVDNDTAEDSDHSQNESFENRSDEEANITSGNWNDTGEFLFILYWQVVFFKR